MLRRASNMIEPERESTFAKNFSETWKITITEHDLRRAVRRLGPGWYVYNTLSTWNPSKWSVFSLRVQNQTCKLKGDKTSEQEIFTPCQTATSEKSAIGATIAMISYDNFSIIIIIIGAPIG